MSSEINDSLENSLEAYWFRKLDNLYSIWSPRKEVLKQTFMEFVAHQEGRPIREVAPGVAEYITKYHLGDFL